MWGYILQIIVFLLALLGVMSKSVKTDEKGNSVPWKFGLLALTPMGKVIITLLCLSFILTLFTTYKSGKEARELEETLRLERDLEGFEISFVPSPSHWAEIARACDKTEPLDPDFPYSASTITAVRAGDHWNLDFLPIKRPAGTIRPGPVSTNTPEGKAFKEAIDNALRELLITWSEDPAMRVEISKMRNYPSSITMSQSKISYTYRHPDVRLNVRKLRGSPTVTFQGKERPAAVSIRSLDHSALFDETVNLKWEDTKGNDHFDKVMPYVSGPHRLKIAFKNLPQ